MNKKLTKVFRIAILVFVTITFLQGCGVVTSIPYDPIQFDKNNSENGLIIGSITFPNEKAKFNGYFIQITSKDSDKKIAQKNSTQIRFVPQQIIKMKHDGQLENGKTYLFVLERKAGNYDIPMLRLFSNYGYSTRDTSINGFNIPFTLKKGEIKYLGNIIFDESFSGNLHPVQMNNNFKRDIEAIKNIQPSVNWNEAINDENIKIEYSKI
jgi:hypothetical protein